MKKWRCYGQVVGSKYLGVVEAETEEEAIDKAADLPTCYVSLCHQCSIECEDPQVVQVDVEEVEE